MNTGKILGIGLAAASVVFAADPTFLRRYLPDVQPCAYDLTANASGATYRPAFGIGDSQASQLKGIARYGELTVAPGGTSAMVSYPAEEQIYYILDGTGTLLYEEQKVPVKKDDFMYLPVGVRHAPLRSAAGQCEPGGAQLRPRVGRPDSNGFQPGRRRG